MSFDLSTVWWLAVAVVVASVFPIILDLRHGCFDPFNPRNPFLLYFALQLGLYPFFVFSSTTTLRYLDKNSPRDIESISLALLVSLLGILTFHLGFALLQRRRNVALSLWRGRFSAQRVSALLIGVLPLVLYCAYETFFVTGLSGYLDDFVAIRYTGGGKSAAIAYIGSTSGLFLGILLLICVRDSASGFKLTIIAAVCMASSLVLTGLTGFRGNLVPAALSIAASWHYVKRRITPYQSLVIVGFIAVAAAAYGSVREEFERRGLADGVGTVELGPTLMHLFVRSPGIEVTAITINQIDEGVGYRYFLPGIWETATMPIPRGIWPGKPEPQGLQYSELFMNQTGGGISMTVIGYLYWQMGTIGVAFGMFLLGVSFGWLYWLFLNSQASSAICLLFLGCYGSLPLFAEAPQETLNRTVINCLLLIPMGLFCRIAKPIAPQSTSAKQRARNADGTGSTSAGSATQPDMAVPNCD